MYRPYNQPYPVYPPFYGFPQNNFSNPQYASHMYSNWTAQNNPEMEQQKVPFPQPAPYGMENLQPPNSQLLPYGMEPQQQLIPRPVSYGMDGQQFNYQQPPLPIHPQSPMPPQQGLYGGEGMPYQQPAKSSSWTEIFKTEKGHVDVNKVMSTAGQMMSTAQQFGSIVKGIGSIFPKV